MSPAGPDLKPAPLPGLSPAQLDHLLERTSRTFALSIPLLPEPLRREVGLAYLLFRIADTFEDAETWPPERQIAALETFVQLLGEPLGAGVEEASAAWLVEPPVAHDGYLELLRATPEVLAAFAGIEPAARSLIGEHLTRTARGMAGFVERRKAGGRLVLANLAELQSYCYVVAGIVGEMLTELFLLGRSQLAGAASFLRARAVRFGEALQLVNILKDAGADLGFGRQFLPAAVPRGEVFALARRSLEAAGEYVRQLAERRAPAGLVAFTALPVRMAAASLERVERDGPGAKLSRPEVFRMLEEIRRQVAELEAAPAAG